MRRPPKETPTESPRKNTGNSTTETTTDRSKPKTREETATDRPKPRTQKKPGQQQKEELNFDAKKTGSVTSATVDADAMAVDDGHVDHQAEMVAAVIEATRPLSFRRQGTQLP